MSKKKITLEDISRTHRMRQEEIKSGQRIVPSDEESWELRDDLNTRMEVHVLKARKAIEKGWEEFRHFLIH